MISRSFIRWSLAGYLNPDPAFRKQAWQELLLTDPTPVVEETDKLPPYVRFIRNSESETVERSRLRRAQMQTPCSLQFRWDTYLDMDGLYYEDYLANTAQLILPHVKRFQIINESESRKSGCQGNGYLFTDTGGYRFSGAALTPLGESLKLSDDSDFQGVVIGKWNCSVGLSCGRIQLAVVLNSCE